VKGRFSIRKRSHHRTWLALGLLTCAFLFWLGDDAWQAPGDGFSTLALLGAFVAVWVGPALLAVTILWGSFAFFRWLCRGAFD